MNVLIISPLSVRPANDGGRRRILELAKGLARRASVTMVCPRGDRDDRANLPFRLLEYSTEGLRRQVLNPALAWKIRQLLTDEDFDLIWQQHVWNCGTVALAGIGRRIPVYLDAPDVVSAYPEQLRMPYRWLVRPIERLAFRQAARIFVVSDIDRQRCTALGVRPSKLEVMPNGVDTAAFYPDGEIRARVRAELGLVADEQLVIVFGQFAYPANRDALRTMVMRILPNLGARFRVLVVGRGLTARDRVRLSAFPRLIVKGEVDEISHYINAADVAAVPLRWGTGTRLKILEAVACGVPVVSTAIGCEGLDRTLLGGMVAVTDEWSEWPDALAAAARAGGSPSEAFVSAYDWRSIITELKLP